MPLVAEARRVLVSPWLTECRAVSPRRRPPWRLGQPRAQTTPTMLSRLTQTVDLTATAEQVSAERRTTDHQRVRDPARRDPARRDGLWAECLQVRRATLLLVLLAVAAAAPPRRRRRFT